MSETLTLPIGFPVGEIAEWVGWGGRNASYVPALIAAVGDVSDAEPRPVPKWVAVKQVGDIAAPILEDSPLYRQSVVAGEPEVFIRSEELRFGNGAVFAKFLEKLPQIIAILTALKPLVS